MSVPPSKILTHAAHVVVASQARPADAALRAYLAERDRLSGAEKREVSRAVFAYFRWLRWVDPKEPLPAGIGRALALQDAFARDPGTVKPEALAARAVPGWLGEEMELPVAFLRELQREPVLWLRARSGTGGELAARLGDAVRFAADGAAGAADALAYRGPTDLFRTDAFRAGAFEIQDLASQWVGWICAPRPGETWWDACAGEGGKSLHLADLMGNRGVVWATDRSARRLDVLRRRAARAGLYNIRAAERAPRGPIFDGILVDAPCSGIGTWQRNPHARWTTFPADVRELAAAQAALLASASGLVKPGGRLVYSVCTLTRSETAAVAEAFITSHPEFAPEPMALPGASSAAPGPAALWPHAFHSNGMFAARWRRKPS